MIKLILFDLDGVLIDAKDIHYRALNQALGKYYNISHDEHLNIYDGHKTRKKLQMLSEAKGLPLELHDEIYNRKQAITQREICKLKPSNAIVKLFRQLIDDDYKIGVCSNSIRQTVLTALAKSQLIEFCSVIISNEDVKNSKPHPEMYWKAMSIMGVLPEETIIVEDSPPGILAAERSRAKYIRVTSPIEVNISNILPQITGEPIVYKWKNKNMNVLIPMAGAGSRFAEAGYTFPKPLIDVNGQPMIELVVDNIGIEANYIFVVQREHRDLYNLDTMLGLIAPGCKIVEVDGITEGAACTALLAKEYIDNDEPLFIANSDQYVEWDPIEFMYSMQERQLDGGMVCFKSRHPKWSYASVDLRSNLVTAVAEKDPISDCATVGFYYWKKGSDFVKYTLEMIDEDERVNGEFYICPVFNQAIADAKKIGVTTTQKMWGLGTPEDLEYYLEHKEQK